MATRPSHRGSRHVARACAVSPSITTQQQQALNAYLDELDGWNHRINLTAVPRAVAWSRHVQQSLELLDVAGPSPGWSVVDVGSGNGAPGVIVAVVRPDLAMTLLEADARKAAFLAHVAGLLGLTNVHVAAMRAEAAGRLESMRERIDLAFSRAAAPAPVLCELALPLVRRGGRLCALVGDAHAAALECAAAARLCGGGQPSAATPGMLVVAKVTGTPDAYPRRAGLPARLPLR